MTVPLCTPPTTPGPRPALPVELQRRRRYSPELARLVRKRSGATAVDVAGELGVSPNTVYRWETGLRWPQGQTRERYFELLDALDTFGSAA